MLLLSPGARKPSKPARHSRSWAKLVKVSWLYRCLHRYSQAGSAPTGPAADGAVLQDAVISYSSWFNAGGVPATAHDRHLPLQNL